LFLWCHCIRQKSCPGRNVLHGVTLVFSFCLQDYLKPIFFQCAKKQARWNRTRTVGHRTRDSMARLCRPHEDNVADTSTDVEAPQPSSTISISSSSSNVWNRGMAQSQSGGAAEVEENIVNIEPVVAVPIREPEERLGGPGKL
jgi:hypothetical protein